MKKMISGLIPIRTESKRLPKKCFLPFGEWSVLEHVIRRAIHFNFDPVICTTSKQFDDVLFDFVKQNGWKVYRGSENDKIKRLRDACNYYDINEFITIDADDPFFDPQADRRSFNLLKRGYDFVLPPSNYYCGSVGYSTRRIILDRAIQEFDTSKSEMIWMIIEKLEGLNITELELDNDRMSKIRLTLDYEEDYHILLAVLRILGPFAESHHIEELFTKNPDLYKINWFRQKQWKQNQACF